jgi:predicted dehydrogenase
MKSSLNRRAFLKNTILATGALSAARFLPAPYILAAENTGNTLKCAVIGCGGRAMAHLDWIVTQAKDKVVAIVDPDAKRHAVVKKWLEGKGQDCTNLAVFTDYRKMFDQMGKQVDAFFIAAPNHHHAPAAMRAMKLNKGVYCEKPLTHDIAEARLLREASFKSKAPTQMGNQGHCEEGYRRLCEFIWGGVIGKVTETHSWTDRANGGFGPRPPYERVPAGLDWDSWIGPAAYRDYHDDLHPHEWHGWFDFGNGSLGNMGCHVLDGVYWALRLEHPTTIECLEIREGTEERYPTGSRIRWDFPARGDMPPVKVYWYEGIRKDIDAKAVGNLRAAKGNARNFPPLLLELQKQYPDEDIVDSSDSGTLYVGDKGVIYTATYGGRMHIVPREKMNEITPPPKTLPRPKNIMADFLDACRSGQKETASSFDYSARMTEFTLLGNLAQHAGVGKVVEWDGPKMRVKNLRELNRWVKFPYRKGWKA